MRRRRERNLRRSYRIGSDQIRGLAWIPCLALFAASAAAVYRIGFPLRLGLFFLCCCCYDQERLDVAQLVLAHSRSLSLSLIVLVCLCVCAAAVPPRN